MANVIANIFKISELRRRIFYTLGMLAIFRLGIFVTVPGVNRQEMESFVSKSTGSLLGQLNMFSGGALEKASIFALGIMPYITASIVLQVLSIIVPSLEQMRKEGEQGQRKINQYTRYGTIGLACVQGYMMTTFWEAQGSLVPNPGMGFRLLAVLTLATGTAFLMWMGEQITERGIGNGSSMIIFAGIVADLPDALTAFFTGAGKGGGQSGRLVVVLIGLVVIATIVVVCFFERAYRRIPIQYTKRQASQFSSVQANLPIKLNIANVMPPIFASTLLMFPAQIAQWTNNTWVARAAALITGNTWQHGVVFAGLILFFAYFYTSIVFNPVDVADNLKKAGGFVPGIRPGKSTAEYIDRVVSRLTLVGATYLTVVCLLPLILDKFFQLPFYFGGTGLLIVVGVALDTLAQIEEQLVSRSYEGFGGPQGPRLRARVPAGAVVAGS